MRAPPIEWSATKLRYWCFHAYYLPTCTLQGSEDGVQRSEDGVQSSEDGVHPNAAVSVSRPRRDGPKRQRMDQDRDVVPTSARLVGPDVTPTKWSDLFLKEDLAEWMQGNQGV